MSIQVDFLTQLKLIICPFENMCPLPKKDFLCKIPECKNCTDYTVNLKKLKSRILF